uniref:Uncharacterized protein n=1 Tax=Triticum urartu TaxID=4572 RepID=A0A8R7R1L4_TRIUA
RFFFSRSKHKLSPGPDPREGSSLANAALFKARQTPSRKPPDPDETTPQRGEALASGQRRRRSDGVLRLMGRVRRPVRAALPRRPHHHSLLYEVPALRREARAQGHRRPRGDFAISA